MYDGGYLPGDGSHVRALCQVNGHWGVCDTLARARWYQGHHNGGEDVYVSHDDVLYKGMPRVLLYHVLSVCLWTSIYSCPMVSDFLLRQEMWLGIVCDIPRMLL